MSYDTKCNLSTFCGLFSSQPFCRIFASAMIPTKSVVRQVVKIEFTCCVKAKPVLRVNFLAVASFQTIIGD